MVKKKTGSSKRLGSRYGLKVRKNIDKVEKLKNAKQRCLFCRALGSKRISFGIWKCPKCGSTFTSKSYYVAKPKSKGGKQHEIEGESFEEYTETEEEKEEKHIKEEELTE